MLHSKTFGGVGGFSDFPPAGGSTETTWSEKSRCPHHSHLWGSLRLSVPFVTSQQFISRGERVARKTQKNKIKEKQYFSFSYSVLGSKGKEKTFRLADKANSQLRADYMSGLDGAAAVDSTAKHRKDERQQSWLILSGVPYIQSPSHIKANPALQPLYPHPLPQQSPENYLRRLVMSRKMRQQPVGNTLH